MPRLPAEHPSFPELEGDVAVWVIPTQPSESGPGLKLFHLAGHGAACMRGRRHVALPYSAAEALGLRMCGNCKLRAQNDARRAELAAALGFDRLQALVDEINAASLELGFYEITLRYRPHEGAKTKTAQNLWTSTPPGANDG